MNKILIYIFTSTILFFFSACELDIEPTEAVSEEQVFEDVESAKALMNGTYRLGYVSGWSTGWPHENFGVTSINLLTDLMGEDHLMLSQGQGWFYEDYRLNVYADYSGTSGRSYVLWLFYYTLITNVNKIIAYETTLPGDPAQVNNLMGEAYAMRAYSYFQLAQFFQQTYVGNEDKPGVPIYTKPTTKQTKGEPRGTLRDTYARINEDIKKAIELFGKDKLEGEQKSNIDYYIAHGIKARIDLVQNNYSDAAKAAEIALTQPTLSLLRTQDFAGVNDASYKNVMQGYTILPDQATAWASFFSHMDADGQLYASKAPQAISKWLYDQIPANDTRKDWWRGEIAEPIGETSYQSYCQLKFKFKNATTISGDYVLMRAEEMVLIKAESECQQGQFSQARKTLLSLGEIRMIGAAGQTPYADRLATFTDSKEYNQDTQGALTTLMDEILFQRRIELWGENGRVLDLQRLKLGYDRSKGGNHSILTPIARTGVASRFFIMLIPQKEFDGNDNMDAVTDQNPIPGR